MLTHQINIVIIRHTIIIYKFKFSSCAIVSPINGIFFMIFRSFCVTMFVINSAIHIYKIALNKPIINIFSRINKNFVYYNIILKYYYSIINNKHECSKI